MKKKQNFLFLVLTIILFTAKQSNSKENLENEIGLNNAILNIKTLGEFEKVKYEFIGDPKKNSAAIIKLSLYNSKIMGLDSESIGKKCASLIFKASNKTKEFSTVFVSINFNKNKKRKDLFKKGNMTVSLTEKKRNFVFSTTDL